jgi:hypothetical protein
MTAGMLPVAAVGQEDTSITGQPEGSIWQFHYRRHTPFGREYQIQNFQGSVGFGQTANCVLSRTGDLVSKMYLVMKIPPIAHPEETEGLMDAGSGVDLDNSNWAAWVDCPGHAFVRSATLKVGGIELDRQYGEWLEIWEQLTGKPGKRLNEMVGRSANFKQLFKNSKRAQTLYTPMQFFCCRNRGLPLLMVALPYHEIRVVIEFRPLTECYITSDMGDGVASRPINLVTGAPLGPSDLQAHMVVDYVFLGRKERIRICNAQFDMPITQVQRQAGTMLRGSTDVMDQYTSDQAVPFHLSHPVKFITWFVHAQEHIKNNNWFNWTHPVTGLDPVASMRLTLNQHDIFRDGDPVMYRCVVPRESFTNIPGRTFYVYTWAVDPERDQFSGSLNFSRVDDATLHISLKPGAGNCKVHLFALSINKFRVMGGMAGVAYT